MIDLNLSTAIKLVIALPSHPARPFPDSRAAMRDVPNARWLSPGNDAAHHRPHCVSRS